MIQYGDQDGDKMAKKIRKAESYFWQLVATIIVVIIAYALGGIVSGFIATLILALFWRDEIVKLAKHISNFTPISDAIDWIRKALK